MKAKLTKRCLSLLLTMCMLLGLLPTAMATNGSTYSDTQGHWAESSIERWSDYGIIQGNNGKFNPSGNLTRAHMAAILSRLLKLPEAADAGFKDVNGEWFADSINRCAAAGIMLGDNGYANPDATITRQQAVVMLGRALGIQPVKNADLSQYTDADQVSAYAVGYVAAMAEAGIVKGTTATSLSPLSNINRAATVTILDRAIEVYANEQGMKVEAEGTGLVLVVADKVKVTAPEGTVVVVPAHVKNTVVNGEKVVGGQAYEAPAELPAIGGGGGGGGFVPPTAEDMPDITEPTTVSGGTYQNVTITEDVANGEVTLSDLTINGDLTIQGGGSGTIKLIRCIIRGKIIMEKDSSASEAQPPRVLLTATNVPVVEATQPAIIESADGSSVSNLSAKADITIQGTQTNVQSVTVPADAVDPIVAVADGAKVVTVVVQSPATVAADADASVSNVTAQDNVSIASGAVGTITVPAAAENVEIEVQIGAALDHLNAQGNGTTIAADGAVNNVTAQKNVTVASGSVGTVTVPAAAGAVRITVDSGATVEDLSINKASGTTITNNGTVESVSSDLATTPEFTSNGDNAIDPETVHFHKWDQGEITTPATCTADGVLTYACEAEGCTVPAATKTHVILASGHDWAKEWTAVEGTDTHERVCANDPTHKDIAAHTWNAGVITTAATCTTAGEKLFTCTGCKTTRTEVIDALGHDFDDDGIYDGKDAETHWYNCNRNCGEKSISTHNVVTDAAVAATCLTTGLTEGSHCSDCNYVIVAQTGIAALGHDFTGEYSKDENGHWHVCAREGCEVTDNKLAHTFDTKNCEQDATCTACEYVKPAGQHAWNTGVITKAANCTADGVKTYTCTSCHDTKTEIIPALGHAFDTDGVYDGKDASGHWYNCNRYCGAKNVLEHTVVTDKAVVATCTTTGLTEGSHCSDCNYVIVAQRGIAALGHDFTGEYSKDEIGHWHVCGRDNCEVTDNKLAHTFDTKNCEQDATCTVCQYVKPAGQHAWNTGVITSAATCTADGVKTYTCTSCYDTKTEVVPKLGHDFDTDGVYDGKDASGHWYNCNRYCGAKNVLEHTVVTDKAVAATCTTTGLTEGSHCSDCNYVIAKQTLIAVLGHDFTGEYSKDEVGHWHVCGRDNCEVTDNKLAHTFDTKNCAEKATCTACKYEKAAGEHTWNAGTVTTAATCDTAGVKTYTCNSCYDTKTETVPALGHKWSTWVQYNAEQHYHYCTNNYNHTEYADHAFGDDYTCDDCGYGKSATYSVYIRHMQEELGTVKDALQIVNGKLQITIPGYGTYAVGQTLPQITREGWTYNGWSVGVDDGGDGWAFQAENLTALTADVEKELLKAIDNGHLIFLNCIGEPMGANGFSVELSVDTYDMGYKLIPPADRTDAMYYLTFVSTDRASSYSCSVWAEKDYEGFVMASQLPESGHHYFGAFEVRDEKNNLLAVTGERDSFPAFFASIYGSSLADHDTPVVTINYAASDANNIVYEISGLTTMMNYQLTDSKGSMYILGDAIDTGKVTLTTGVNNPLSGPAKLHGVAAFNNSGFGMETMKPVTVSVPTFDPNQMGVSTLNSLISEAEKLGLTKYLDTTTLVSGGQITRLQAAMLISAMIGLTPADSNGKNWPYTDGANLTADQKALITALNMEGIIAGYSDGSFRPNDTLTNAAIVKLLDGALGQPVVPITKTNNVDTTHWVYLPFTMLDNLGILNRVDISVNSFAVTEDVLTMFIDARTWRNNNPKNPQYPVTGVALAEGPLSVVWNAPAVAGLNYKYKMTAVATSGNRMTFGAGGDTMVPLYGLNGETYNFIEVDTYVDGRYCGSTSTAVNIQVSETVTFNAEPTFTKNADGTITLSITGLTPGVFWHMYLGEEILDFGMGIGSKAGTDGTYSTVLSPEASALVKDGGYYLLREYPTIQLGADGKTLTMSIVDCDAWTQCKVTGGSTAQDYKVTNIRFEDGYLRWAAPTAVAGTAGVDYMVRLYSNGIHMDNCGTSSLDVAAISFAPGTYDKVRISTLVNDVEMDSVEQTINLTITQGTDKAAPSSVAFDELTTATGALYGYQMTVTGLTANTPYILRVVNHPTDWNSGSFHDVVSDANGKAITTFNDVDLVKTGYYQIVEQTSSTVTDNGQTCTVSFTYRGAAEKCFSITNTVWFKAYDDGFLELIWDYKELSNASDYNFYRIEVYNSLTGEWVKLTEESIGSVCTLINCPRCVPGTYTKVRLTAMKEEQNSNGEWYISAKETWFETDIHLTIGEEATAPTATIVKNANGEHTFNIANLFGQMNSSVEVMNSEEAGGYGYRYGDSFPTNGYGKATLTVDWPYVETGYYRVREFVNLSASGTAAAFDIRDSGWQKCFGCSHTVSNTAPVSNIHLDGSWIVWDEPTVANTNYGYEISLSEDGGQTWSVNAFRGDKNNLMTIYLKEGNYNAVRVKTFLTESCGCDVEVGMVLDTTFSLKVTETAAATPADVAFSLKADGTDIYTVTIEGLQPYGNYDLGLAMSANGENQRGSYGGPSANNQGVAVTDVASHSSETMEYILTNGYYLLTEFACDDTNNGKTGTLDRITHGSWTKSVISTSTYSDEAWFEVKGDGSLYFCWDMTPMANADDYANGYSVYFNDGTNWERVDGAGKNKSFWRVNSPGVEAGSYIGIKLVGRNSSGAETSTWFEVACALDIVSTDPSEANVTFTANTDGTYNVEVSDMTTAAQVAELVVSDKEGLGDIDYMVDDLGGYNSTLFENETICYPNGYYRVREYSSLYADKLTARFGIFESAWTKMNLGGGSVADPYQVSNIRFEDYYGQKMLMWDAPATTDDVKYRVYVKDANGEWDEVSGTSQTLLGIADADFNGTYTGVMVRTILKSDNSVKAEATADLSLTVTHKTSATAATVSYTQKTPGDDYWFYENTSGLTPNTQYEIYLRDASGNDAGTFGGTADVNGQVVNSECGSSNLADVLNGGSYLVYEYTDYAVSADGKTLSYTCTKLGDWTKFESGSTGTDPVFGTPVLKTDGTFIWMELTVQNVEDPSDLALWTKHTYTYTSSSSSSTNQYSNEIYWYQMDGNTLKLYQAGNVLVNQENHSIQLAVKDPVTGIMSAYTTNSLVYGTETAENISVTAVKVPASEADKYNRLNVTRADGANFTAGHYHIKRPSTMDYTNMHYVEADKATLSISASDTAILGTTSVTPKKIVPVLNADGNIVMNKAVYNTYTFNDVVLAGIASAAGSGVVSAAKGLPVSLTMTLPSGVELKTTTPTITCRTYNTTISNVVVDGNKITFDATFGNLYRDEDTLFYLADTDTNLGYPLCTETLAIDHVEVLTITAQSNVTELQLGFGEAVTFYNKDGTAIAATDTATVHQQIAEKIAVYKNGVDMGLTFEAGYNYGERNFYFVYGGTGAVTEDADYTVVFKDGVYVRSTSNPNKGYIGDINIRYLGPQINTCQVNLSTGMMTLRVDAQDRVAETLPVFDFSKLSIACAPSGYWSYDEYQTDLVGDYAMVDGTAPTEKGTYTITKWVAEKYNSGGYVYERRFWDLSIMLTDADLALYQSVADDYNGTDQFSMVTHDGWMTGSAKESLSGGLTMMKDLTIQNETDAYVYYDYSSNNHSASGSVWSGGTNSLSMYFAAESINLTYNDIKIAVALPADGVLVVKKEMFAQA